MGVPSLSHARRVFALALPLGLVMCSGGPMTASQGRPSSASGGEADAGTHVASEGGTGASTSSGSSSGTNGGDGAASSGTGSSGGGASSGSGSSSGGSGAPADCPASDVGNTPLGQDTPDPTGTAVDAITYTSVGATGSYDQVVTSTVAPTCVANVCDKTPKAVSGPLVPFDDEMTMVLSGPMDLYQVAAYEPGGDGYQRVAYWDCCTTEGLAFVGNKAWYTCNGYVQSYVSNDGSAESDTPVQFAGHLDPGVGVNIMSDVLCTGTTAGTDCGFSRGLALHGFKGDAAGSKISRRSSGCRSET